MNIVDVSVIIPCFNHGKYIDEAINSILKQTFQRYEIIIIDDGSTDTFTIDKLLNFNNPRINVIRTINRGLSAARNLGIKKSKGRYILTLDADDKFYPTFLEKAIRVLNKSPHVGAVTCFVQEFGLRKNIWFPKGGNVKNFLIENNCCGNALFRRKCWEEIGGYDESMKDGYEDWNFWIMITKKGWVIRTIKEILFFYRITENSMRTKSNKKHAELVRQIILRNKEVFREYIDYILYEKEKKIIELINKKRKFLDIISHLIPKNFI